MHSERRVVHVCCTCAVIQEPVRSPSKALARRTAGPSLLMPHHHPAGVFLELACPSSNSHKALTALRHSWAKLAVTNKPTFNHGPAPFSLIFLHSQTTVTKYLHQPSSTTPHPRTFGFVPATKSPKNSSARTAYASVNNARWRRAPS